MSDEEAPDYARILAGILAKLPHIDPYSEQAWQSMKAIRDHGEKIRLSLGKVAVLAREAQVPEQQRDAFATIAEKLASIKSLPIPEDGALEEAQDALEAGISAVKFDDLESMQEVAAEVTSRPDWKDALSNVAKSISEPLREDPKTAITWLYWYLCLLTGVPLTGDIPSPQAQLLVVVLALLSVVCEAL